MFRAAPQVALTDSRVGVNPTNDFTSRCSNADVQSCWRNFLRIIEELHISVPQDIFSNQRARTIGAHSVDDEDFIGMDWIIVSENRIETLFDKMLFVTARDDDSQ